MGKTNQKKRSFECTGVKDDSFARIYNSMLTHPAFIALKTRQKVLYLYAKNQFYGTRKPGKDFKDDPRLQEDTMFYLNFGLVVNKYGLYSRNGQHEFYSDVQALIDAGFIERVANGKSTKSRSIYKFSSNWKFKTLMGNDTQGKQ